ncbi:MAG: DUF262 domain-containing protein [Chloroflexi bacterium]|nr:DUF262 domain-containing protein [Chloroflexota bacterium]MBN9396911.1 DUF262 domain-containing protein [Candidatus Melainabacteria bacterium]OJV90351.1 MAG: hypothetical protein BGO39_18040 [Chloroflexi bacterium 54-19]
MIKALDQEIQSLVADIRDGKLLLPEIQRGYVWKSTQVRSLFDSLYHQYPSGQLLVWETDDIPSAKVASVDGLLKSNMHPQLLLDGQQRLTSLTAVMLGRDLKVKDLRRKMEVVFNVYTEKFEIKGPRQAGQSGWIELAKFFTEGAMKTFWELKLDNTSPESQQVFERLNRLENIKKYTYRVILLEKLSYEEVTDIFIRINSGGTILGNADLALAQVSSRWTGVTQLFEDYQQYIKKQFTGLEVDNGLLLRAIVVSLTNQSLFNVFLKPDHQQITVNDLEAAWKRVQQAFTQAVNFLVHNCQIDRLDLLPTRNILIPLTAFFEKFNDHITAEQTRDLQRWVYMALIWTRYSTATESKLNEDLAELTKEKPVKEMIQNIEDVVGHNRLITERDLQDQRKNSPYMVMSYVLARRAGAQDWFNGVVIGGSQNLEFHHIFPKSLLEETYKLKEDSRIVDQVANLAFLSAKANKKISNSNPADYLPGIEQNRLIAQHVTMDLSLWKIEKFEDFVRQRRTMLADAINSLLASLSGEGTTLPTGSTQIMAARVDAIEHNMRDLLAGRLEEARGPSAWKQLVPDPIKQQVQDRIGQRIKNNPFEAGKHDTLEAKLVQCQFSDYFNIIQVKSNWPFFEDVFGGYETFKKYSVPVIGIRNSLKHNKPLGHIELHEAEAAISWFEDCFHQLSVVEQAETEAEEQPDLESVEV